MQQIVMMYVPCPSTKIAQHIAQQLLKARHIACANIIQSTSIYHDNDATINTKEHLLIMKLSTAKERIVRKELEHMHPYATPCILSWSAAANAPYASWVRIACGKRISIRRAASGKR